MTNVHQQPHELPANLERYLLMWGDWVMHYSAGPARVHASPMIQTGDKHSTRAEALFEGSDVWVVRCVDASVESLSERLHRLVLHVEYANRSGPAVWRNNRLPRDPVGFDALLNEAKWALVPILRRKDVPL